jgi:predicted ATPase with chaperone activity
VGELHLLMIDSPSSGKTMFAKRLPTILPPIISGNYGCDETIKFKSKV